MIYLIDDKIERQKNLGWNSQLIKSYSDVLFPIYSRLDLDKAKSDIFIGENVVLFHESFFDNPSNTHAKDAIQIRKDITEYAEKRKVIVVFFGGSISSRSIDKNTAYLPVQALYNNLREFAEKYRSDKNTVVINQIVFGQEYKKEELLLLKSKIWNLLYDHSPQSSVVMSAVLNNWIEDFEKLIGAKIKTENITVEYLKSQIQQHGL